MRSVSTLFFWSCSSVTASSTHCSTTRSLSFFSSVQMSGVVVVSSTVTLLSDVIFSDPSTLSLSPCPRKTEQQHQHSFTTPHSEMEHFQKLWGSVPSLQYILYTQNVVSLKSWWPRVFCSFDQSTDRNFKTCFLYFYKTIICWLLSLSDALRTLWF